MLLALDTATRLASIALYDGERVVAEHSWHSRQRHTVELMPHVDALCRQMGASPADLSTVAVAIGPGSFTGLRVALSAAKGLAAARSLPLLGVPTLDATAYPWQWQPLPVCALVQAGRGRVCWALYAWQEGVWSAQTEAAIGEVPRLAEQVVSDSQCGSQTGVLFCGELSADTTRILRASLGDRAHFLPPALAMRRAGYLAELAWARFHQGESDDVATLSPIYLHQPPPGQYTASMAAV